ncbi:hypothetical protein SAMN05216276_100244 [Streptosporangium subroseum]|uniref:Uncharacterized protein n=1 Tax=Streptosporangium subroseum TaxID=106412 RepID=A0A239ANR7_9ACTN|nr:hypothetical protein [Streptosporangium subroseum]SNR97001.1 hypothetical protein SAMN05216276_100244 [Streptosporangium subroseum]
MAEIIKTLLDPRKIQRYLEGIVDVEDVDAKDRISGFFATGEIWADSSLNAIALDPTHCDHALIKYELWDGEPAATDWDESQSGSIHLTSGKVYAISSWSGGVTYNEEFDLGRRDQEWRFRIHRKFLSDEDFTTDIISLVLFKVQFWSPAEASRPSREEESTHTP